MSAKKTEFYVTCGIKDEPMKAFAWKIWSHQTSFYLAPASVGLKGFKISLHGPDPRHDGVGFFKAEQYGLEGLHAIFGQWPFKFPGRRVADGVREVARIRWLDSAWRHGRGAPIRRPKPHQFAFYAPAPSEPGEYTDIRLLLAENGTAVHPGRPLHKEYGNAAFQGPIRNDAGHLLSLQTYKGYQGNSPLPDVVRGCRPDSQADAVHAVGCGVDDDGLLWIVEQAMSQRYLREHSASGE